MNFMLDTSILSDLMRDDPRVRSRFHRLNASDTVHICTIVRGEIEYGIQRLPDGRRRRTLRDKADGLLAAIPCEPVPPKAAEHYAAVKREREKSGLVLDENDLWIAATALALDHTLITRDRDFQQIDGLRTEDWISDESRSR